ncbi:MAG: DUF4024 domain-containing protein [Ectobacillus sp.]
MVGFSVTNFYLFFDKKVTFVFFLRYPLINELLLSHHIVSALTPHTRLEG